jgi:hypothetical protein
MGGLFLLGLVFGGLHGFGLRGVKGLENGEAHIEQALKGE